MQPSSPVELPYATAKSLRILGKIRVTDQDFRVDEIPAYPAAGDGGHLFVRFRKTGLDTPVAVRRLAEALGCDPKSAGFAGLKDRHAVTTQWASFEGPSPEQALDLSLPGIVVLEAARHPHKLRTGHLQGNRFEIRIREPEGTLATAQTLLATLAADGVPNYYGQQRFGGGGQNLTRARAWIVEGGRAPRDRFQRKLMVSTLQSDLFNRWLSARVREEALSTAIPGDLLRKEDTGGLFTTDDLQDAVRRVRSFEVSPTGPMFGAKMRWPLADAAERERAILDAAGITDDMLSAARRHGEGARRVARVRPTEADVHVVEEDVVATFTLPKGAYATVVLRELMKAEL